MDWQFLQNTFRSEYHRGPVAIVAVGLLCLAGTALFKIGLPQGLGRFFYNMMVLLFLLALCFGRINPLKETAFRLLVLAVLLPYFEFSYFYLVDPDAAVEYWDGGGLYRLFYFLPIAWWLGGRVENGLVIYGLALIGLFIAVLLTPDLVTDLNRLSAGERVDFGMKSPQYTGVLFGVAFIGVVIFQQRIFSVFGANRVAAYIVTFVSGAFTLSGLIVSQTRAAWLGLLVLTVIYLLWKSVAAVKHKQVAGILWKAAPLFLIVASLIAWKYESIELRLTEENEVIANVVQGNLDNVPYTSIGIRIHYWIEATKWIKERPLTGWGYGVRTKFIKKSDVIPEDMKKYGPQHVHNSYLAVLLSYGIIGLVFVIYVFTMLISKAREHYKRGDLPEDVYIFSLAFVLFFGVVNLFESYLFIWTGIFLVGLVFAPSYTLSIKQFMNKNYSTKMELR